MTTAGRALLLQPRKRKYGGRLCVDHAGVLYDSIAERQRAWELQRLLDAGQIDWWSWGPRYVLSDAYVANVTLKHVAAVTYRPDFVVCENGVVRVEDVKGVKTREFNLKAKLWGARYPDVELRVIQ